MFKSIFKRKPRLDHADPLVRQAALDQLNNLSFDDYSRIARTDDDLSVRKSALRKANSLDLYREFMDNELLSKFCCEHIIEKIDDTHELAQDPRIFPLRLQRIEDPQLILDQVSKMESAAKSAATIMAMPSRELRLAVSKQIDDLILIAEIEKQSRNRDKSLNRLLRDRLTVHRELLQEKSRLEQLALEISKRAKVTTVEDIHYQVRRSALEREWTEIMDQINLLNGRLKEHRETVIDTESLLKEFPQRVDQSPQSVEQPVNFAAILMKLKNCNGTVEEIDTCEHDWLEALKVRAAPSETADEFYHLANQKRKEIRRLQVRAEQKQTLDRLLKPIAWKTPDKTIRDWGRVWQSYDRAKVRIRAIDKFRRTLKVKHEPEHEDWNSSLLALSTTLKERIELCDTLRTKHLDQFHKHIEAATKFVESGELKKAQSEERAAQTLMNRLPRDEQRKIATVFVPVSASVRKLAGWQEFAETPKREDLCKAIEELARNPLTPERQFEKIRELREAWIQLSPPRSRTERDLQDRYDSAATVAFKVCEDWFEKRAQLRQRNLQARAVIVEQVRSFNEQSDIENMDWSEAQHILKTSVAKWRTLFPVERAENKPLQKEFDKHIKELRSKITTFWDTNKAQKQSIVAAVREALDNDELTIENLLDFVVEQQGQWKSIPTAGPRFEGRLWREFSSLCNEAFDLRTTQKEQRRSEINENIKEAERLVKSLEDLLKQNNVFADQSVNQVLQETVAQIETIDLPKRIHNKITDKVAELTRVIKQKLAEHKVREIYENLESLLELDKEISELEAKDEEISEDFRTKLGEFQPWFLQRSAETASKNAISLHDIVLRTEILADVPSPESDAAKRMQIQVSRLQQGLSSGGQSDEQRIEPLIEKWCSMAFGEQPLRERFHNAAKAYLKSQN